MAGLTFLRVVSNAELDKQEQEAAQKALQERQNQPMVLGLSEHIRMCWDAAKIAKKPIKTRCSWPCVSATASMSQRN